MKSTSNFFSTPLKRFKTRIFKALAAKLKIEMTGPNQIKKTILEMYIQEKEEEYYNQHTAEFYDSSGQSTYYFSFLNNHDRKSKLLYILLIHQLNFKSLRSIR